MRVGFHPPHMEGPAPEKPQRPPCDFDIPENMPVFDSDSAQAEALERDDVVVNNLGEELHPVLMGAKEDDRVEAELQIRFAQDFRLLQDSALALKSVVTRELDRHRQLSEKLLTRQHDRACRASSPSCVTGVIRRPLGHVRDTSPRLESAAGGGTTRPSFPLGQDTSPRADSCLPPQGTRMSYRRNSSSARPGCLSPQGTEFGLVDTTSTKHSAYQDFRAVAQHMAVAATQAFAPSRRQTTESTFDRQGSPASQYELSRHPSSIAPPRDNEPDGKRRKDDGGPMAPRPIMEQAAKLGKQDWIYEKRRDEIMDSYKRMKEDNRKMLLGWAGFEDADGEYSRSWEQALNLGHDSHLCKKLRKLITSRGFSSTIAFMILANAIFIGVAADSTLRTVAQRFDAGKTPLELTDTTEPWERAIDIAFTSFFGVELLLRIFTFQVSFFIGPEWKWNLLDSGIVFLALFELVLLHYNLGDSWARLFRLLRLGRSLRVMRVLRFFRRLRLMLVSVLSSIIPLVWAVVFLLLVLFVFSVLIAYGVSQWFAEVHKDSVDSEVREKILYYFGDVRMVLISHFIAVTGGISWWELAELLHEISWTYVGVFIAYVTVTMLMVLNIITGIFVNDSIEIAQTDREFASETLMQKEKLVFKELERTFHELDVDGDGFLLFDEFEEKVKDPEVRAVFNALQLDVTDALRFFRLLDIDKSHAVEIDEFVIGCMNIKGQVGTISLESMMTENKRMMRSYVRAQRRLEDVLTKQFQSLQKTLKEGNGFSIDDAMDWVRDERKHRGSASPRSERGP